MIREFNLNIFLCGVLVFTSGFEFLCRLQQKNSSFFHLFIFGIINFFVADEKEGDSWRVAIGIYLRQVCSSNDNIL